MEIPVLDPFSVFAWLLGTLGHQLDNHQGSPRRGWQHGAPSSQLYCSVYAESRQKMLKLNIEPHCHAQRLIDSPQFVTHCVFQFHSLTKFVAVITIFQQVHRTVSGGWTEIAGSCTLWIMPTTTILSAWISPIKLWKSSWLILIRQLWHTFNSTTSLVEWNPRIWLPR